MATSCATAETYEEVKQMHSFKGYTADATSAPATANANQQKKREENQRFSDGIGGTPTIAREASW